MNYLCFNIGGALGNQVSKNVIERLKMQRDFVSMRENN